MVLSLDQQLLTTPLLVTSTTMIMVAGNIDEIRRGTRKCLISASSLAVVPDDEDQITGNGDTVNILSVVTIFSSGVALCYICDVRE